MVLGDGRRSDIAAALVRGRSRASRRSCRRSDSRMRSSTCSPPGRHASREPCVMIALIRTEFTKAALTDAHVGHRLILVGPADVDRRRDQRPTAIGRARGRRRGAVPARIAERPARAGRGVERDERVPARSSSPARSPATPWPATPAWGNLRYLLMRPVPRARLLLAKAFVAGDAHLGGNDPGHARRARRRGRAVRRARGEHPGLRWFASAFARLHLSSGALLLRVVIATALRRVRVHRAAGDRHALLDADRHRRERDRRDRRRVHRLGDPRQHHPTRPGALRLPDALLRRVGDDVHRQHATRTR